MGGGLKKSCRTLRINSRVAIFKTEQSMASLEPKSSSLGAPPADLAVSTTPWRSRPGEFRKAHDAFESTSPEDAGSPAEGTAAP
jgi:hypothetical protein